MSRANPMLAWYGPATIAALPGRLHLDPESERQAVDLTLRDAVGHWWRPQRDGSWLCHDGEEWASGTPPETLEGVAPLPVGAAAVQPPAGGEPSAAAPQEVPAPEGLQRGIERICGAYRSGEMVSTMAELLLADWMLLTPDGRLWTVGAQSQIWHAYGAQGWEPQSAAPAGPFLAGEQARAVSGVPGSPARTWAERGPYLPEAVSPPWEPPPPPLAGPTADPPRAAHPAPPAPVAPAPAPPAPVAPPGAPVGAPPGPSAAGLPARGPADLLLLVAALAPAASAFLPWRGHWDLHAFTTSAAFLWNVNADDGWFSIGLVSLLLGLAALSTVLLSSLRRYRRVVGGIAAGLAILWLVETFRYLIWFDPWPRLGAMFTQEFAVGPWLALAGGLLLLLKRR
ncbi:MAG: hypothetical protein FJW79_05195 [Actinobacteria bacterium]|nr:hypothetical protein [Actinomycetota bacterium]